MAKDIPNQPSIGGPPIVAFPVLSANFQSAADPILPIHPVTLLGLDIASTNPVLQWSPSTRRFPFSFPTIAPQQVRKDYPNPFVPNLHTTARTFPVDYSDNESQVKILQHHYLTEFSTDHHDTSQKGKNKDWWKEEEMLKDYTDDTVIYQVVDGVPATYRGKRGIREMLLLQYYDNCHMGDPKNSSSSNTAAKVGVDHVELQHVAVNHNHAQVIWKGQDSQSRTTRIVGTDSFTFDQDNHIVKQTIVAITAHCNNDNHYDSDFF